VAICVVCDVDFGTSFLFSRDPSPLLEMTTMTAWDSATVLSKSSVGRYAANVSPQWTVGDTAQGGYAVALLVKAIQQELSPAFPDPLVRLCVRDAYNHASEPLIV
jgi:hypothetical protein